ncbi:hypothetical protein HPB50_000917 [Hyalomma asiaticum]|uniref:Uncharacterized protein n=1 Tax=Hyalomma asiaticum TaxID=266040 RepID=A0ACB7SD49_HYAAI|nr:hypothetical protein HPB50_000917 [Hyalomma asiaticum]
MPATVEVEGMDASPEELEDAGWTAAFRSRKGDVRNGPSGGGGQRGGVKAMAGSGKVQEARSSQREASARSHSRGRSQPDKHTTWVDKAKNQPKPGPPERRGRSPSRSEHVVNPRMLALEAENKQLRRDLAELKAAFESFKERAQGDRKEHGPLWGQAKRRALDPAEGQSESTAAVVAGQLEAAPSSMAGGVEDRWARMETTLSRMMDVLSSLEGRITVLERPKALAKGRHEMAAESQLHDPGPSREGSAAADVIKCAS